MALSQAQSLEQAFEKALQFHYTQKDSAYHYYEIVIALAKQQNDKEAEILGLTYLLNANNNYYDLEGQSQNIRRADSLVKNTPGIDSISMGLYFKDNLFFEKGSYQYKLKNYGLAESNFYDYYEKLKSIPDAELTRVEIDMISALLSYLGLCYRHSGKYEEAEIYFKKDIDWVRTYQDSIPEWQSTVFNTKKLLSQVYEVQGRYEWANQLLKEALQFYRSRLEDPRQKNNFTSTFILLSENLIEQHHYAEALEVLNSNQGLIDGENTFSKEVSVLYGEVFTGLKDYNKAEGFYQNALNGFKTYRSNKPHEDVAGVLAKMAKMALKQGDYEQGLNIIVNAYKSAGSHLQDLDPNANPDPTLVFNKIQYLKLLDIKLQLLNLGYKISNDDVYLELALRTNYKILETFDLLKNEFDSKLDKQLLIERVYPMFDRMLEVTYGAYSISPSPEYLELALTISEKNKDFVLLEALRGAQATAYGEVPKNIIEKETRLRAEIGQIEKNFFETNDESVYSELLFQAKHEYFRFLDSLKIKHPKYHRLKYNNETTTLKDIRERLYKGHQTLISYTLAEDFAYVLIFTKNEERFLRLPFTQESRSKVLEFYELISKPDLNRGLRDIKVLGEQLYQSLLEKPLQDITSTELTVISDAELHYLPFDLLVKNGEYLVYEKSISYGNSITSLIELEAKSAEVKNELLAFAPAFDADGAPADSRQFGQLLYNDDEVHEIQTYFKANAVTNESATLNNFISQASDYRFIHLATHASANDAYPDYSYLAFTQNDTLSSNILYVKDLYDAHIPAEMVTLSACQTGIGKLQKGQGMLSLSKGFYYAGAKSLVNTLWKINDRSSIGIMGAFYEELSEGKSKSEALRQAKVKYLKSLDDDYLKHPYYWGAFTVSGNNSPVINPINYWVWAVMAVLIVFGAFLVLKKTRKS